MKIDNVLDMLVLADLLKAVAVVKSVAVAMKFMLENAMVLVSQDAENLKKKLGKYPDILVECLWRQRTPTAKEDDEVRSSTYLYLYTS